MRVRAAEYIYWKRLVESSFGSMHHGLQAPKYTICASSREQNVILKQKNTSHLEQSNMYRVQQWRLESREYAIKEEKKWGKQRNFVRLAGWHSGSVRNVYVLLCRRMGCSNWMRFCLRPTEKRSEFRSYIIFTSHIFTFYLLEPSIKSICGAHHCWHCSSRTLSANQLCCFAILDFAVGSSLLKITPTIWYIHSPFGI